MLLQSSFTENNFSNFVRSSFNVQWFFFSPFRITKKTPVSKDFLVNVYIQGYLLVNNWGMFDWHNHYFLFWSVRHAAESHLNAVLVSAPKEQKAFCSIGWNNQPGILLFVPPWTADKNLSILAFVCFPKFPLWHKNNVLVVCSSNHTKACKRTNFLGCHQWETHFSCSIHLEWQTTEK